MLSITSRQYASLDRGARDRFYADLDSYLAESFPEYDVNRRRALIQDCRAGCGVSARSAYALLVLAALFRWLIEQRYVLANPFAGVKVRSTRPGAKDNGRAFSDDWWSLVRTVADGLEWSYEREALDRYLVQRSLPVTPEQWKPSTPIVGKLKHRGAITATRLWSIVKRFFATAASVVDERSPATAVNLRRATPHWIRHTHATHALDGGAKLKTVRDNLSHPLIATTSVYLPGDEVRQAL